MKIRYILLAAVLLLSLIGCGGGEAESTPTPEPTPLHMQGLDTVFDMVREVEVGTAGASLKAVFPAVNLLSWMEFANPDGEALKALGAAYVGDGSSEEFELQMQLVFDTCQRLTTEQGAGLMEDANVRSDGYPWDPYDADRVGMLMNGMGMVPVIDETPAASERPAAMMETILNGEGMEETVSYTLVQGDGWSFYLTDGDWKENDLGGWTAIYNEQVHFWIADYPGKTAEQIRQLLQGEGFDESLFKNEGTFQNAVAFDGYAFMYETPANFEYVEGWGVTLAAMARTFEVD